MSTKSEKSNENSAAQDYQAYERAGYTQVLHTLNKVYNTAQYLLNLINRKLLILSNRNTDI